MKTVMFVMILSLTVGQTAQRTQIQPSASFKFENTPDNLKAMMQLVFRKVYVEKSSKEAAALFLSSVPDESRARKALKDGLDRETLQKILDFHKSILSAGDESVSKLAQPEQTNVKVTGASTEEIKAYREGSVAFNSFPGGATRVAEFLRPGVTFYEVEFLEPGKPNGIQYHLFYWDGQRWSMLGPL